MSTPAYELEDARCITCDHANLDNPQTIIDQPCPTNDGICAHCCWDGQWWGELFICEDCEAVIREWKRQGNAA